MTDAATSPAAPTVELALGRIITAAAGDAALHRRLKADPAAVLRDAGLAVPAGVTVTVEEVARDGAAGVLARSTDDHLVLPLPPLADGALSDEDLDAVAGGGPLEGLWSAVTLPFNLATRFMNSNSGHGLGEYASELAAGVTQKWNNPNTV
ncbi:hypothetical protein [Azospirillum sp. ST 5-10]|uniref:hypothetical protein n=1 Tax=unclassified Azospirillum TaxID=2630922 RepID=UPI003F4A0327